MGVFTLMLPLFAQQTAELPGSFYFLAVITGLAVGIVYRKPKTLGETGQFVVLSLGGLIPMLLLMAVINVWGSANWKSFAGDMHARLGATSFFVAFGGSLWGILRATADDMKEMNVFEAIGWLRSGGKRMPRHLRKPR